MTCNMTSITRMHSIHSWLLQVSELYLHDSSMRIIHDRPWAFRSTRGYIFSDRTADYHPIARNTRVKKAAIDLQKMHWKFRAGVHEHPGVCLKRHCGHHGPGGYTPCISEYGSVLRRSKLYTQSCNRPIAKTMCGWCGGPRC